MYYDFDLDPSSFTAPLTIVIPDRSLYQLNLATGYENVGMSSRVRFNLLLA